MMSPVRTTIDLPEDLHRQAMAIARDTSRTLSDTVADLMRRGLNSAGGGKVAVSRKTGLPVVRVGHVVTSEDVRNLDDDPQ
jgi:hypothetical protein